MSARITETGPSSPSRLPGVRYRRSLQPGDVDSLRKLVLAVGVFSPQEQSIAVELAEARLRSGPRSGYSFILARSGESLAGYTAYGRIPATRESFDLYWIVVDPLHQGRGLGSDLLARTERSITRAGGRRIYIETSSREEYAAARALYRRAGYVQCALLQDFYAPQDSKLIFCKPVGPGKR